MLLLKIRQKSGFSGRGAQVRPQHGLQPLDHDGRQDAQGDVPRDGQDAAIQDQGPQADGGYGSDNPGSKSQGMKQLMAGGGIIVIGTTLIPLLSGLF